MKSFLLIFCTLAGSLALGNPTSPLLVKSMGGGFLPPELSNAETCEVFANRVVVTYYSASTSSVIEKELSIDAAALQRLAGLIQKAQAGVVEDVGILPADAPTTEYVALVGNTPNPKHVLLLLQFGDLPIKRNNSPEAATLVNILNDMCH